MSDTSVDESIETRLAAFGLNQIEARIYIHLVGRQPKTILEIASEIGLPRTSVYDNAVKLAEKGLVQKLVTFKSQKLQAYPLEILQAYIDKEKARVDSLQDQLAVLEASLAQTADLPRGTEVRYYHGAAGFRQMMWNSLRANGETVGYSQFGRSEVVGDSFTNKHAEEMIRRGILDRVITNQRPETLKYLLQDPSSEQRKAYQQTRIMPPEKLHASGDITIYNDIFSVTYWQHGETVGVEIENPELVKTQKTIFEQMWELAEPFVYPE